MKQVFLFFCTTAILIACGDDEKPAAPAGEVIVKAATETVSEAEPDSATMMKNRAEYMEPGKEHKMMASWEGKWNTEVTMWMTPDAPPAKSVGTTVNKMILGGRYQESVHKSTWNGMPFEGRSTLAYDNARKLFISTWMDNMGTGLMGGEGPWDETTKSFTVKGKMIDPSLKKEVVFKEVFTIIDADTQVMQMYMQGTDGKEFKTTEIRYTRTK